MIRYHSGSLQYTFKWRGKKHVASFGGSKNSLSLAAANRYAEQIKNIREQCKLGNISLPIDPPKPVKPLRLKQLIARYEVLAAETSTINHFSGA